MEELELYNPIRDGNTDKTKTPTRGLRELLTIAFRHRWLISLSFLGVLSGAILVAVLQANRYEATIEILVKRDRVDTPAEATTAGMQISPEVTEEELNSEVTLLKSRDLLEQIVLACGLQYPTERPHLGLFAKLTSPDNTNEKSSVAPKQWSQSASFDQRSLPQAASGSFKQGGLASDENIAFEDTRREGLDRQSSAEGASQDAHILDARAGETRSTIPKSASIFAATGLNPSTQGKQEVVISKAIQALDKELKVDVVKKTNLIEATYGSPDPQLAARVLATLANLYMAKHIAVHRPRGAFDFFQRETQRYRQALDDAEKRLLDFDHQAAVVAAPVQKELTLQKLADFQVSLTQTNAEIAETEKRIHELETQIHSMPNRMVTQVRDSENGVLVSELKSNLLTLEQKRIELLQKFEPSYRSVKEIDAQIDQVRAALADKPQLHEQITDRDPTYEWARSELEKARADLVALQARAEVTDAAVRSYEQSARSLDSKEVEQNDILRTIKSAEENYLLSQRKEEEARISDALDRGRILNVAIAEPPSVPALPSNHRFRIVLFGVILAMLVSTVLAFAAERMDSTFRTPNEVVSVLNMPVLAAIPKGVIADRGSLDFNSLIVSATDHKGISPE